MGKTQLKMVGLVLVMSLLVMACGPTEESESTSAGGGEGTAATTEASTSTAPDSDAPSSTVPDSTDATTTAPVDSGTPQEGGTIEIGIMNETDQMFPGYGNIHIDARAIHHLVYGGLMSANTDAEYVPYLAESLTPNEDATVWTVTLRPNLTFHDGTPMNAEALKNAFDRIALESTVAPSFDYYEGTEVVDDLSVEVTMNRPLAVFPQVLADEMGQIPSPTAVEAAGTDRYATSAEFPPVGAGPYQVVEWVRDSHLVLERYDGYPFENRAYADSIVFRVLPDDASRAAALEAGDVDIITTLVPATILSFRDNPGYQTHELGYGSTGILFNVEEVPDIRVRQAIAMAIDRETIVDLVWQNVGEPISNPYPPDNFWYNELDYPEYDPEAAAALIEEVEAETGPVAVSLTPRIDETNVQFGTVVVEGLNAIGIDATLDVSVDTNDFVNRYLEGQYQMMGTGLFTVDVDPWFEYTRRYQSTSLLNGTGFATVYPDAQAEVDEMLAIGEASADRDERKAAYDRVQEILAENLLQLFVNSNVYGVITTQEIQGFGTGTNPDGTTSLGNYFTAIRADEYWLASG